MAALGAIQRATHKIVQSGPAAAAVISHSLIDSACPPICQAKRRKQPRTPLSAALHSSWATCWIGAESERPGRISEIRREDPSAVREGLGSSMVARRNSRLSFAMNRTLIDFGQTASHSYWLPQDPNPSRSMAATMALARFVAPADLAVTRQGARLAANSVADAFLHAATHAPHEMQRRHP